MLCHGKILFEVRTGLRDKKKYALAGFYKSGAGRRPETGLKMNNAGERNATMRGEKPRHSAGA
jgi:hypothetical protein